MDEKELIQKNYEIACARIKSAQKEIDEIDRGIRYPVTPTRRGDLLRVIYTQEHIIEQLKKA